jgi:uncharacterized protein DUF3450
MFSSSASFAENKLQTAVEETLETHSQAIKSQQNIDEYADDTKNMLHQYRTTLRKIDSLRTYNDQLEKLTAKQLKSATSISNQISSIAETQQNIVPLLLRMIEVLEEFVSLDAPFLQEERTTRINLIKDMMERPDVSLPDKYRRIMETYQIEMEYGRTIDTMTETIQTNNTPSTVEILRIGRLSIFYQTLDGKKSGYWDKREKQWKPLSKEYHRSISQGIQIAKKQAPPNLIKLPITAPEEIK